jgi:hypothetical protein
MSLIYRELSPECRPKRYCRHVFVEAEGNPDLLAIHFWEFAMHQIQVYVAKRLRIHLARPMAAALVAACCVSGCGITSTASTASIAPGTPASSGAPAGQAATSTGQSTPGAALTDWIRQVAAGDRSAACQDMRASGMSAKKAMATCMSAAGQATFTSLHGNFVIDGIKSSTPIKITNAHVSGTNATVDGSAIQVSGTTLNSLMTKHSTGIKPGQLDISFQLSRVDGAWYVTGMNMNV